MTESEAMETILYLLIVLVGIYAFEAWWKHRLKRRPPVPNVRLRKDD